MNSDELARKIEELFRDLDMVVYKLECLSLRKNPSGPLNEASSARSSRAYVTVCRTSHYTTSEIYSFKLDFLNYPDPCCIYRVSTFCAPGVFLEGTS